MLYPIEIKVNLEDGVGAVMDRLGDPPPSGKRQIWFAEDRDGLDSHELRLLAAGIVLRLRSGDGDDDATAKLRPAPVERLIAPWDRPFTTGRLEYRVEGDRSGARQVLSASAVTKETQGSLAAAVTGGRADPALWSYHARFVTVGA
ncbi:hypothetical protein [Nocardia bovistercoris]|uniref:Uncharacterized protein n=1 Tax=Nocardia bovistercoris TaxID=2785916 RepID=A0A931IJ97_9NOCA|nr:hypothetical protein [Nocardia bovistercoris]MBH0780700.1 hypothetical protein [Nocardia bovistercoris]